jgi:uncharacterized protein YbjT (DUF2867 family)
MIAILGATGKVGRATIRRLYGDGVKVRAVVRDTSRAEALAASRCEIAVADFRSTEALCAALHGASTVQVICPMSVQSNDARNDMGQIIEAIGSALDATKPSSVIAISDYGAELDAGTGVTMVFHDFEARLRKIPTSLTFLRSAEHMQNWRRVSNIVATTGTLPVMHHPLLKMFPAVSAFDVGTISAEFLVNPARQTEPRIVSIEGPRRYTPLDVASAFSKGSGRKIAAHELPRAEWISSLMRGGASQNYAELVAELYDAHNAGKIDVAKEYQSVRRGKTELDAVIAEIIAPVSDWTAASPQKVLQ